MIELKPTESDDPAFVGLVARVLNGAVLRYEPVDIYVVQIDGWFDHKWLAFAGKILGAVGVWKVRLTVPPFNPHRVVSQLYLKADPSVPGAYEPLAAEEIHIDQWSDSNLRRWVRGISERGLFLWYSSGTAHSDRGSILAYNTDAEREIGWYVSFRKDAVWKVHRVKGDTYKRDLLLLMGAAEAATGT
jgi:hypothetical protein